MRFVICGVAHETHTFSTILADRKAFQIKELTVGDEIINTFHGTRTEAGGFIDYCEQESIEIIPILTGFAQPSGIVTTAALEEFLEITIKMIKEAGPVDAVLA